MFASYLALSFFYIAFALIVYALIDEDYNEVFIEYNNNEDYWHQIIYLNRGEHND